MVSERNFLLFRNLAKLAAVLALAVIMLGAYVRLSDAGLGCPDWPGCYGHLGVPETESDIALANQAFPERPVEAAKAWKEMVHRYFAGILGLLILGLAIIAIRNRRYQFQPVTLPLMLLVLVVFQALLGMWTVTLKVKPIIVMSHLLGGFATLALLWWLLIATREWTFRDKLSSAWSVLGWLGMLLLLLQIMLGGWTSTNYAALACVDFPKCHQQWWPQMDFREAFVLWRGLGIDYEFGVLESPARTAIHVTHRVGALIVGTYLLCYGIAIFMRTHDTVLKTAAGVMLLLLTAQVSLGISNVVFHLPLMVAVAHNGVAALLLLSLIGLIHLMYRSRRSDPFSS